MNILNWIIKAFCLYWLDFLVIMVFVLLMWGLLRKGMKREAVKLITSLVAQAEKEFGRKSGKYKLHWVYEKLPSLVRAFITAKEFEDYVRVAVENLHKYLADYDLNGDIKQ